MKNKHPEWTEKQANCCLYWQSSVRKELKVEANKFLESNIGYEVNYTPEAMGLKVTETLKNNGIILEHLFRFLSAYQGYI